MRDSPEKHGPYPPPAPAPRGFANHVGDLGPEREKVKGSPPLPLESSAVGGRRWEGVFFQWLGFVSGATLPDGTLTLLVSTRESSVIDYIGLT